MLRIQNINKNIRFCVPCVPSCLPLFSNGKQMQTSSCKAFSIFVYHVYDYLTCAHVHIFSINHCYSILNNCYYFFSTLKKFSCARKFYLNGTHGTQINITIENKGFPVFTILNNAKHDHTHGTHLLKKRILMWKNI